MTIFMALLILWVIYRIATYNTWAIVGDIKVLVTILFAMFKKGAIVIERTVRLLAGRRTVEVK